jgi:hypothetical protein
MPCTDADAFELIAEALEDPAVIVKPVVLRIPPGRTAYELVFSQAPGLAPIYAKVQLGGGRVLARSFHYSDYAEKPR